MWALGSCEGGRCCWWTPSNWNNRTWFVHMAVCDWCICCKGSKEPFIGETFILVRCFSAAGIFATMTKACSTPCLCFIDSFICWCSWVLLSIVSNDAGEEIVLINMICFPHEIAGSFFLSGRCRSCSYSRRHGCRWNPCRQVFNTISQLYCRTISIHHCFLDSMS